MSYPSSMDVLECLVCLVLFLVLVMLVSLSIRVAHTVSPLPRPLWPWSITTYNGWNQAIPSLPAVHASFPRPWA